MQATIRAVLAGCGGVSAAWLRPAVEIEGLEIVGLVDLNEESARQRAAEFGLQDAEIETHLTRTLERTRPDVVFNCTVPEAHAAVTIEALRQGCHVLGEKPLADSMANAERMLSAARAAGKTFAVMQNRRFLGSIRMVEGYLRSGELGALTTVHSDFFLAPHFGGFREQMRHVLLLDMAIHTFDQARMLTGADPVEVYCKEWNPSGSWYAHDASAVAVFTFSNGVVYTYRGSWCAEGMQTTWESDWRLIGERGSLRWDGGEQMEAEVIARAAGQPPEGNFSELRKGVIDPYTGSKVGGHSGLIRDFIACLSEDRVPETICFDNIKSLAMVFAAVESAETGLPVRIHNT